MPVSGGERKAQFSNATQYLTSCKVVEYLDDFCDRSIVPADEVERVFSGHFAGPSGIAFDTFRRSEQELKKTGRTLPFFPGPGSSLRYRA